MVAVDTNIVRGIMGSVALLLVYGYSFWRIFKRNPDNKVIECGSITLMVFVVMAALFKIPNFPVWILALLGLLVVLLGLLTMCFLVQQGYRALRRRPFLVRKARRSWERIASRGDRPSHPIWLTPLPEK